MKTPYAETISRNNVTWKRIGHWMELCAYYTDGQSVFCANGSSWVNCGSLSDFRENGPKRNRGEFYFGD